MRIILDTNFILIPSQFKVDIFSEIDRIMLEHYELCVLDRTIAELESIRDGKGQKMRNREAAKLGLKLLEAKKVNVIKTQGGYADNLLVQMAGKETIIATQDMVLKSRIRDKDCPLIVLRSKKHLIRQ